MVILTPGGTIALRKIGEAPGDRIYAAELLQIIDRLAQTHGLERRGPALTTGGFAPLERFNLRIGTGLGLAQTRNGGDSGFAAGLELAALYPVSRHIMLGGLTRALTRPLAATATRLDMDAVVRLRAPLLHDNGEAYLQIPIGLALHITNDDADPNERTGYNSGAALGVQFAPKPSMAVFLELGAALRRFAGRDGADDLVELHYTAGGGVGFLF
jgi:hypothetical protein